MSEAITARAFTRSRKMTALNGTRAYMQLKKEITDSGILDRSYSYYSFIITLIVLGIFISGYLLFVSTLPLQVIFWSIVFSFFSVQVAGLMHDCGHRAIFSSVKINDIFGHIFGAFTSTGYSSWKHRHNLHHAHPNDTEKDPDIIGYPILSFSIDKFKQNNNRVIAFLRKHQVVFYYPLILLFNIGMRIYPFFYFKKKLNIHNSWEVAVYAAGMFFWFALPFFIFNLHKALLTVFVINLATGFYIMNIFAPNHKPMPLIAKGRKLSFMEQQILTSCNVTAHWLTDFVYFGLNYQIEHHLFPNCPRNKLKYITPFVQKYCRKMNLEYTKVSILTVNKMILTRLHEISSTIEL